MDGSAIRYSNTPEYTIPIFTLVTEVFFGVVTAGSYPTRIYPTSIQSGIKFTRRDGDANIMLVRPEHP